MLCKDRSARQVSAMLTHAAVDATAQRSRCTASSRDPQVSPAEMRSCLSQDFTGTGPLRIVSESLMSSDAGDVVCQRPSACNQTTRVQHLLAARNHIRPSLELPAGFVMIACPKKVSSLPLTKRAVLGAFVI